MSIKQDLACKEKKKCHPSFCLLIHEALWLLRIFLYYVLSTLLVRRIVFTL